MRVLLLNQFFWPDSSATSQLLTDLARSLADQGHDVTAISSGAGGYGITDTPAGAPAVRSLRVKALPFGRGTIGRLLSYATFYTTAAWRGVRLPRQDVVLTLTTPPLLPLLGTLLKTVRGTRHVIWEMDMYPDVATDLGYFVRGGALDRIVGWLADLARSRADRIIALGDCMRTRLLARAIPADRITVAHNWADGSAIVPLARVGKATELVVLYSGNLGLAHDLSTILAAMATLGEDKRFRFLFVGSGGRRAELAAAAEQCKLTQVNLRPYVERDSLCESLAAGDIGLVTQREECCGSVVPSKVYGLLAAGRPVLYIGPAAATPALLIERFGCGWHIPVGEPERLVNLLRYLAEHRDEVRDAGDRARRALLEHFDLPIGVGRIQAILHAVSPVTNASMVDGTSRRLSKSSLTIDSKPLSEALSCNAPRSVAAERSPSRGDHHTCTL